jgi:GT2 family glycosyltransferase
MPSTGHPLARTALAISAFRTDETILAHLRALFDGGAPAFGAVIVVDSLGSGRIEQEICANGWPVEYENAPINLGSAGNLQRRLEIAAELGLDWCLAVNHDGMVDQERAARLVRYGESGDRIGAVYPALRLTSADNRWEKPRRRRSVFGLLLNAAGPAADSKVIDVAWGSSNGALYRLDPIRQKVRAWPELWMGYEDLALGWEYQKAGWRQVLAMDVEVDDNYEFRPVRIFGKIVHLADKPIWYSYYQGRNLWLIARGTRCDALSRTSAAVRLLVDIALIAGFGPDKRKRFSLLLRGVQDGLRGMVGKGPVP